MAAGPMPQLSILLPTYNESENLPLIIALLERELARIDDLTWEVRAYKERREKILRERRRKEKEKEKKKGSREEVVRLGGCRRW